MYSRGRTSSRNKGPTPAPYAVRSPCCSGPSDTVFTDSVIIVTAIAVTITLPNNSYLVKEISGFVIELY